MKKIVYILLFILLIGCTNTKVQSKPMNEQEFNQSTVKEKNKSEPKKPNYDRGNIQDYELDYIGLPKPASLREISDKLTDEERNKINNIRIENGENITTLDGIELFPALKDLNIYNSKIKNLNDIQRKYLKIERLLIESKEMDDISNIIFFENLEVLNLWDLEKIKYFPDITRLKKLWSLSLSNLKGIKINNIVEKLPLGIQMIHLRDCNINSLDEISNFFKRKIRLFDLSENLIKEIDFNMDYGAAEYIYMPGCPAGYKYMKWDELNSREYQGYVSIANGVSFDFGPFQDEAWVKEEKTVKNKNKPKKPNYDRGQIQEYELNYMGLPRPASLKEISTRLTDVERKKITSISIYNGININRLDGIELFPALEDLRIYNSKIKNLNDIQKKYLNIKRLLIESNEMEDISNIIYFENLDILHLFSFEKIKSFPDITRLKKLRWLNLYNCKGINFNNIAEKLPLGIKMIGLRDCNIKSLNDIAKLFKTNVICFDLQYNPIKETDSYIDYGAARYIYIYMHGCPAGDKYPVRKYDNGKGVEFDFGFYTEISVENLIYTPFQEER
jgi:hypothetical protein